jgi:hypothetical protein
MVALLTVVFPEPLPLVDTHTADADDHWLFEVTEDFDVVLEFWTGQKLILATIEQGFRTDGATVPWFARRWFHPWDKTGPEAVLHDWFLDLRARGHLTKPKYLLDLMFLLAMVARGVSFLRATIMFAAVRTQR